jgi:hypothetical protein
MNRGPLRRLLGSVGLLLLAPLGAMMLVGRLGPVEAAQRALVVLLVVLVVGRLAGAYLHAVASRFEPNVDRQLEARLELLRSRAQGDQAGATRDHGGADT